MLSKKILLSLLIIGFASIFAIVVIVASLSNSFSGTSNTDSRNDSYKVNSGIDQSAQQSPGTHDELDEIQIKLVNENSTFSQVIVKKFELDSTPETNIQAVVTSNASFILQVCARNTSNHYDSLDILKGSEVLTHFNLVNDTDFKCATNSGNAGDKIDITTVNVSGVTKLIAVLKTTADAKASITYPS